jgi:hypothetical protein
MRIVGDHLAEFATKSGDATHLDLFGRSAFNRYYYAAYLITREMLGQLDPLWERTSHKSIPDLLRQTVARRIRKEVQQQSGKLISIHEAKQMRIDANNAVGTLAALLTSAYAVRCIADYDPAQRVQFASPTFTLFSHSNHEASGWPKHAAIHCKTILRIWRTLAIT